MLPFFKNKDRQAGLIVKYREPDKKADGGEVEHDDSALISAAEDLKKALNLNDSRQIAAALRAAFQILDSEPHAEDGEDLDESEGQ